MTTPEDDEARLVEWQELLPGARGRLEAGLGVTLDGTPESLVPLWSTAMPRVRISTVGEEPETAYPSWLRWPETMPRSGTGPSAATYHLIGDAAAYYGQLLAASVGPPALAWIVLRIPEFPSVDEGRLVLANLDPAGHATGWVNPLQDLTVLVGAQFSDPDLPAVGKGDPKRLFTLFGMRRQSLGG